MIEGRRLIRFAEYDSRGYMEITRTLARFVVEHDAAGIPQKVRHEAARSFLNWLGCAVGGSRHETVERALAALAPFSGPPKRRCSGAATASTSCTPRS